MPDQHTPVDLALDPATGDLDLTGGSPRFIEGGDAIRQHLEVRLGIARGEWYQDLRVGVPLYERVLVSGDDIPTVLGVYRRVIATTAGIVEVLSLDHEYDAGTRQIRITGSARTVDDDVIVFGHEVFAA